MDSQRINEMIFKDNLARKMAAWAIVCLLGSIIVFMDFWKNIGKLFSFSYISSTGAYSWAVLLLCTFWIYMKRGVILEKMRMGERRNPVFYIIALLLVAASIKAGSYYGDLPFTTFRLLLFSLGIFFIFFGDAAIIPATLLGVYGFAILSPVMISRFLDPEYSIATTRGVMAVLNGLGYQMYSNGQTIAFLDISDRKIFVFVDAACSGSASMTLFIAIFMLMVLDIRLPPAKTIYMFLFGVLGTSLQNILRLIVLLLAGYYYGSNALWTAHTYAGYILFPTWFAFFAFVYLKQAKK